MNVNGLILSARPEEIVEKIKNELEREHGIFKFKRVKSLESDFMFSCPFHNDGQERNPSCGMTRDITYSGSKMIEPGTVHCFTCGYIETLPRFISNAFGRNDGGFYGMQWLKKNFTALEQVQRKPIELNFNRGRRNEVVEVKRNPIPEEVLDSYRYEHDYMYERGLNLDVIEKFDVGYDFETTCLTFPIHDMDGNAIFIYRRSVHSKFHKYGEGDEKTDYIYGAYQLDKYFGKVADVFVVESIINCLTLWTYGIPAVSIMGTGGGNQYKLLSELNCNRLIIALDPDNAGDIGTDKIIKNLSRKKLVTPFEYPTFMLQQELDINDVKDKISDIPQFIKYMV